jgi:hypothetical protein
VGEAPFLPAAAPALRPAADDLQALLPSAKLLHGGKVLQLTANTSFLGNRDLGQKVVVRECCVRLWERERERERSWRRTSGRARKAGSPQARQVSQV